MVKRRGWGIWPTLGILMTLSTFARASNSASEIVTLRHLWERAIAAEERSDWAAAEQALIEAVGIKETPGLRYHLAHCREMQRKWVEALVDYKSVEEQIAAGISAPDVEPLLHPAIERLEAQVPKLTIVVTPVEGLSLHIDGQQTSVKLLGRPIALNPGGHRIALSAPGVEPSIQNLTLEESEMRELHMSLQPRDHVEVVKSDRFSAKPYLLVGEAAAALSALGFALYHRLEAVDARQQELDAFAREQDLMALGWTVGAGVLTAAFATTWIVWSDDDAPAEHALTPMNAKRAHTSFVQLAAGWSSVTLKGVF